MKIIKFIVLVLAISFVGCSKDNEEPQTKYVLDEIIGRWTTTAYYSSGEYFAPNSDGEYYEFKDDRTCVHYAGQIIDEYTNYKCGYNETTTTISCAHDGGWNITIRVEFISKNEAVFYITGKTSNSTKTIKVIRNK